MRSLIYRSRLFHSRVFASFSFVTLVALVAAAAGPALSQTQRVDVEAGVPAYLEKHPAEARRFIKDYLAKNPQVLQEALVELLRPGAATVLDQAAVIKSFHSSKRVALGNPKGDVTLAEFVDYNCGFCRRALDDMLMLIGSDADLRVILIEHPVLGTASTEAARVAIAAQMQDGSAATALELHRRLLSGPAPVNKARALAIAVDLGLDLARLETDMAREEVDATLDEGRKLARALGIRGTPSYVVGGSVVFGAVGTSTLRDKIAAARQR